MFVIVLATTISGDADLHFICDDLDALVGRENWHCDLADPDKVLCIRIEYNLGRVFDVLDAACFRYGLMNLYDTRLGLDCPLLASDFGGTSWC